MPPELPALPAPFGGLPPVPMAALPAANVMLVPPLLPPAPGFCQDGLLGLLHASSEIAAKPARFVEPTVSLSFACALQPRRGLSHPTAIFSCCRCILTAGI